MTSVGVVYVGWDLRGNDRMLQALDRSVKSLYRFHDGIPVKVVELPTGSTLLDKASMFDLSPFDLTLFLDMDTVVMDALDYGFAMAHRHHLACCVCEAPYARRFARAAQGDLVEYNTGVLFFDRSPECRSLFKAWERLNREVDSSLDFVLDGQVKRMPLNDQAGFALAVDEVKMCPFVLPNNWNFRPLWYRTGFGPLKVWHDMGDVPSWLTEFNERQRAGETLDFFEIIPQHPPRPSLAA
jgi:hypothetical protein